jgi:GNAT superfamily N-acetyltransferase
LRFPRGFEPGSERLADDNLSIHAWVVVDDIVVSVGRAHLILADSDGGGADNEGIGAAQCPGFSPLSLKDENFPTPEVLRPAFHVRQMGTLESHRRHGHARAVLSALELKTKEEWDVQSGWLQARTEAVPFYESCGWSTYSDEYHIDGIGPHRSMWRLFP